MIHARSIEPRHATSIRTTIGRHRRAIIRRPIALGLVPLLVAAAAVVGVVATVVSPVSVSSAGATTPGTPGVTQAATVLYDEGFENTVKGGGLPVSRFTGVAGDTFTADSFYLDYTQCNGVILHGTEQLGGSICSKYANPPQIRINAENSMRGQASALGGFNGLGSNNAAISFLTANLTPPGGLVELETARPATVPGLTGKFLGFSINSAEVCTDGNPHFVQPSFQLFVKTPALTAVTGGVNPCQTYGGAGITNGSVAILATNDQIGFRIVNLSGGGARGNDMGFDDFKVWDRTPQLDKSFSPSTVPVNAQSTATFTITNTSEKSAKNGWSFTDKLPSGLVIANPALAKTTCSAGTVTASGDTVSVTNGGIAAGVASCTVTAQVTSSTAGSYTNKPSNFSSIVGLNPPADATVTFVAPTPFTCTPTAYGLVGTATPDKLESINLTTGAATLLKTQTGTGLINAIGYDTVTNLIYGWDTTNNELALINGDNTATDIGVPAGAAPPAGQAAYDVGDFDRAGHLWLTTSSTTAGASARYVELDLSSSSTAPTVLKSGTTTAPAALSGGADWSWTNGALYRVMTTSAGEAHLVKFDPATGTQTDTGAVTASPAVAATSIAATYTDAAGYLYAQNTTGTIYRVDVAARTAITVATGPASTHDGARCPTAPIPTLTVQKTVGTRVSASDQFVVSLADSAAKVLTSATTSGTAGASTANWPVSVGQTYTITDAMAAGSPDLVNAYTGTLVCTDTTTGASVTTSGAAPKWTVTIASGDNYTCVVNNTKAPRNFSVVKTACITGPVTPGTTIVYTVVVHNTSTVPYSATDPAMFTDDLSDVLDDATYNVDVTGGAKVLGNTLSWSGPLAPMGTAGDTVTITYSVTVNTPDTGNHDIKNAVVTPPEGTCALPTAPGCSVDNPVPAFAIKKVADTTVALPGQKVIYTITVTNTGGFVYTDASPASFTDSLAGVVKDAVYNNDATTTGGTLKYTAATSTTPPVLAWTGALALKATVTIKYSVTVNSPDNGNLSLVNVVVTPPGTGGNCPSATPATDCQTSVPVQQLLIAKTASATTANPGDTVTYQVKLTNTGAVAFAGTNLASFSDDLTSVIDDAAFVSADNGATYNSSTHVLSWTGPLAVTASVTITYSVKISNPDLTGDHTLTNTVVSPPSTGSNCPPGSTDTACTPLPVLIASYVAEKKASVSTTVPGGTVTYTIKVTNTGKLAYSAAAPAMITDDLTKVLDDAAYNKDAIATVGSVTYVEPTLKWSGALAVGQIATITYSVKVSSPDNGDLRLVNAVVTTGVGGNCASGSTSSSCTTTVIDVPPAAAAAVDTGNLAFTGVSAGAQVSAALVVLAIGIGLLLLAGWRRRDSNES